LSAKPYCTVVICIHTRQGVLSAVYKCVNAVTAEAYILSCGAEAHLFKQEFCATSFTFICSFIHSFIRELI